LRPGGCCENRQLPSRAITNIRSVLKGKLVNIPVPLMVAIGVFIVWADVGPATAPGGISLGAGDGAAAERAVTKKKEYTNWISMMATFPLSDFQDINYDLGKRSPFLLIDFREVAISRSDRWG